MLRGWLTPGEDDRPDNTAEDLSKLGGRLDEVTDRLEAIDEETDEIADHVETIDEATEGVDRLFAAVDDLGRTVVSLREQLDEDEAAADEAHHRPDGPTDYPGRRPETDETGRGFQ